MDDAARLVTHRLGTRLEPAIRTVRAPKSGGQVEGTDLVCTTPRLGRRVEIILMDHRVLRLELHEVVQGSPEVLRASTDSVQASSGIGGEAGVDVVRLTVGCRAPYHRRQGLDQPVETLFAVAQRVVAPLLIIDVDVHAVPANILAVESPGTHGGGPKP